MSYILDALKRADAERELGHVPGLHSLASMPQPPAPPRRAAIRPTHAWLGLCVLLLLLAASLWWTGHPAEAPTATPEVRTTVAPIMPPRPVAEPLVAGATNAATVARTAAPSILIPAPTLPIHVPQAPPSSPLGGEPQGHAPAPRGDDPNDAGVHRFADLPPEQRALLPQLKVNGASYSANPAHRMLIVNNAVVHEGGEVAPGVTLERIGLNQSVFNQGGVRFSVAY